MNINFNVIVECQNIQCGEAPFEGRLILANQTRLNVFDVSSTPLGIKVADHHDATWQGPGTHGHGDYNITYQTKFIGKLWCSHRKVEFTDEVNFLEGKPSLKEN